MNRKPLLVGNWKMNSDHRQAATLTRGLVASLTSDDLDAAQVAVLPPFTGLQTVHEVLTTDQPGIVYGAQDLSQHDSGAHTGGVIGAMLRALACTYVLVGHSERRQHHNESDHMVNAKVHAALRHGLIPILCVGEELDVRERNGQVDHCNSQVAAALQAVPAEQARNLVVAYEPVWAIGTGRVATPSDAQEVCGEIRLTLSQVHSGQVAQDVQVLYGGSVKAATTTELIGQPDVDGALVGGASLEVEEFTAIVRAAAMAVRRPPA